MKAVTLACLALVTSVEGHGYVSSPPSRAYKCQQGANRNCGSIQYEPQSVEGPDRFPESGPADGELAGAGRRPQLDEQSATRWSKASASPGSTTFTWVFTAAHVTRDWRYFITKPGWDVNAPLARSSFDLTPFCAVDGRMVPPPPSVSHQCTLPTRSGYHVVLAVWDVGDAASFHQAIDLDFGGGGGNPTPSTSRPATAVPTPTPAATSRPATPVPAPPPSGDGFPSVCVDTVTLGGMSGVLKHPSSGAAYGNSEKKCWRIGCSSVTLRWRSFSTEQGYDFVELYEGAAVKWRASGSALPPSETLARGAVVAFLSDYSVTSAGFEVAWECAGAATPAPAPATPAVQPPFCKSMVAAGGVSGAITYPAQSGAVYGNNEALCWRIACGGGDVSVTFTRLETEQGYDFVSVHRYQPTTGSTAEVLRVGGKVSVPVPQVVRGDALVFFQSDESVTGAGFSLSYTCR